MAMTSKRLLLGLVLPTFVIAGLAGLFGLVGYYQRTRHKEQAAEFYERFAKLESEVAGKDGENLAKLRRIPVLFSERVQPMDSMARQRLRQFTGKRAIFGVDPVVAYLSMAFDGRPMWEDVPLFVVSFGTNKVRFPSLNDEGKVITADGYSADARGRIKTTDGHNVAIEGLFVDDKGNVVTEMGRDAATKRFRRNQDGQLVAKDGSILPKSGFFRGMDSSEKYVSWAQIETGVTQDRLVAMLDDQLAFGKRPRGDQEFILTARDKISFLRRGFISDFKFVPPTQVQIHAETQDRNDWSAVADATKLEHEDPRWGQELAASFDALKTSWIARDADGIGVAADRLSAAIAAFPTAEIPAPESIAQEISYNQKSPFNYAAWLFMAASLMALYALFFKKGALRWLSLLLSVGGIALGLWGFWIRTNLGFGVTITNLYESMVAVAIGTALLSLFIDLGRKSITATLVGGVGAFVILLLLNTYPEKFDPKIGGLVAVLANNFWIHIHVPIVMASYGAYLIAFLLSLVMLPWSFFDPKAKDPELKGLVNTSHIAVALGTILIFVGMILGGLWANDSWGRFWGWDPKETWAFVLFLWYVILIHGRYTGWMNAFFHSWWLFGGGNVLLWTYYGTNELLSGFHSYASSAGDAGFLDNFLHERNRWFVYTTLIMGAISLVSMVAFLLWTSSSKGGKSIAENNAPPLPGPTES